MCRLESTSNHIITFLCQSHVNTAAFHLHKNFHCQSPDSLEWMAFHIPQEEGNKGKDLGLSSSADSLGKIDFDFVDFVMSIGRSIYGPMT